MNWKVSRSCNKCLGCEKDFSEGEVYYSVIDIDEDEPQRVDMCPSCFRERKSEEVVFWRTRKAEKAEPRKVVDFARMREIFIKMAERPDGKHKELAYLMGLLLIRKRYLKLKEFTTREGTDVLILTQPKTEKVFVVEAPLLTAEQMESLRGMLSALVDGELDWEGGDGPTTPRASVDDEEDQSDDGADEPDEEADEPDDEARDSDDEVDDSRLADEPSASGGAEVPEDAEVAADGTGGQAN